MKANLRNMVWIATALLVLAATAMAQSSDNGDKDFDLRSTIGDVHVGSDVSQHDLGVPAYPGARRRVHDEHNNSANLALFTSAFGMKLLVANYDSDDGPAKIVAFYREKLKKYGKVLECHTSSHPGSVNVDDNDGKAKPSKELRCEGNNQGSVIELKAGTEENQHVVAVEPAENGKGAAFAIVYVYTRGKQGDI